MVALLVTALIAAGVTYYAAPAVVMNTLNVLKTVLPWLGFNATWSGDILSLLRHWYPMGRSEFLDPSFLIIDRRSFFEMFFHYWRSSEFWRYAGIGTAVIYGSSFIGIHRLTSTVARLAPLQPSTSHGSARFLSLLGALVLARPRIALGRYKQTEYHEGKRIERLPAGFFIGPGKRRAFEHTLVVGPSGAGKTTWLKKNLARFNPRWGSLVVFSSKDDVFASLGPALKEKFEHVLLLHPKRLEWSEQFNPIPACSDSKRAAQLAATLALSSGVATKDPFWTQAAKLLFYMGLRLLAERGEAPFAALYLYFVKRQFTDIVKDIERSSDEWIRQHVGLFRNLTGGQVNRTLQTVALDLAARLEPLGKKDVAAFTWSNTLDLMALRRQPTALVVVWPTEEHERLRFLYSVLFVNLMHTLFEHPEGRPVFCFLDEAAQISFPLSAFLRTARGYRVSLTLFYQSLSQLAGQSDEGDEHSLLSNFHSKVLLAGAEREDTLYWSQLLGLTTTTTAQRGRSAQPFKLMPASSENRAEGSRELMLPDELRRIRYDEVVAVMGNKPGAILKAPRIPWLLWKTKYRERSDWSFLGQPRAVPEPNPKVIERLFPETDEKTETVVEAEVVHPEHGDGAAAPALELFDPAR